MKPVLVGIALSSVLLLLAAVAFGPCVDERRLPTGLAGFKVAITGTTATGGKGTLTEPYDYPADTVQLSFTAQAIDVHGQPFSWDGDATIQVIPGTVVSPLSIHIAGGVASGTVTASKTFGRVAVWVEDRRWVNGDLAPGDITYQLQTTDGTFATGISNLVYFKNPSLQNIQVDNGVYQAGAGTNDTSALDGYFVEIDCRKDAAGPLPPGHGQLVVTGIFEEGFYVTDLAGGSNPAPIPAGFNHLYVYSYSYPDLIAVGDRVDSLIGTAEEFSGATQISFPAWQRALDQNLDPLPFRIPADQMDVKIPPVLITQALCDNNLDASNAHLCAYNKKDWAMEALESSRVQLTDLRLPDVYINCDFNGDASITSSYPTPDLESACQDACLKRDGATDILAKQIIANDTTLQAMAQNTCPNGTDAECPSGGKCNPDNKICLEVCPFEQTIPNIQPNCLRVRVPETYVCSELSTLKQYAQWTVAMDFGQDPQTHKEVLRLINLDTTDIMPLFDPTSVANLGRRVDSSKGELIQGNLRQVRAARPRWIVMVGELPNDAPAWMKQ